jgi:hypothetical protein
MKPNTNGGLLSGEMIAGAANDDTITLASIAPAGRRDTDDQGWDPFEVWRTRIKEARERHGPSPAGRHKS